jgi:hypothetical protein
MVLVADLTAQGLLAQLTLAVAVVVQEHLVHLLLRVAAGRVDIVKNLSIHHLLHMLTLLEQVEVGAQQEQADLLAALAVPV